MTFVVSFLPLLSKEVYKPSPPRGRLRAWAGGWQTASYEHGKHGDRAGRPWYLSSDSTLPLAGAAAGPPPAREFVREGDGQKRRWPVELPTASADSDPLRAMSGHLDATR